MTVFSAEIRACAERIEALQLRCGSIPWVERGVWDPWNHGESAMALAVAGREAACVRALDALADRQEADGGWRAELGASVPMDAGGMRLDPPETLETVRDTNFTGYAAVTVLRAALALDSPRLIARHFDMVSRALDFVAACQSRHGDVIWKAPGEGECADGLDSLRAGNASLYKSFECGLRMADALGFSRPDWAETRRRIAHALIARSDRFDRTGVDRTRYAMDWYYPVLTGVLTGAAARLRLDAGWTRFVAPGLGCRCVSDEPWVTAAETAELALACLSAGQRAAAEDLMSNLSALQADDGGWWMGWQFELEIVWPRERPSWTAGAVVLAADALHGLSNGSDLLIRHAPADAWVKPGEEARAS